MNKVWVPWQPIRLGLLLSMLFGLPHLCAAASTDLPALLTMDMQQLMSMEVTTADKRAQPLEDVAASMVVLTRQDIMRSGMQTVPELMRLVPGMQVGRIDASTWAISVRGFNRKFARKMLVMVDGRIGWSPVKPLRLSLAANDLFDQRRSQFTYRSSNVEIGRSLHAEATWQWD